MKYLMLSKEMHPSLHFYELPYELPYEIPQWHGKKVYRKGKKDVQVIYSPLMSNPWRSGRNQKK